MWTSYSGEYFLTIRSSRTVEVFKILLGEANLAAVDLVIHTSDETLGIEAHGKHLVGEMTCSRGNSGMDGGFAITVVDEEDGVPKRRHNCLEV